MHRRAFKMRLLPGNVAEYKKRHDEIWPELVELLASVGVSDYSIFLDTDDISLFAVLKCTDPEQLAGLADDPLMKRWWAMMADIMETEADNRPVTVDLTEVFYSP